MVEPQVDNLGIYRPTKVSNMWLFPLLLCHVTHLFFSSAILFSVLPSNTSTIALDGNPHDDNLHTHKQYTNTTLSLGKSTMKNFFITNISTIISIKTTTERGPGDKRMGESVRNCTA